MNHPYRVCLLGSSLDNPNRGVCALAASFFGLVASIRPDAEMYSLYGSRSGGSTQLDLWDKTIPIKIVNFRQSLQSSFRHHIAWILLMSLAYRLLPFEKVRKAICRSTPWIDALDKADFIGEVRGGDSFSDIYGTVRFLVGILPTLSPLLMGKELVMLPQTFIPFRSRMAHFVARRILLSCRDVYVRDANSLGHVKDWLGDAAKVRFCPDMAFSLVPVQAPPQSIDPPLPTNAKLIGLNINGMLYAESEARRTSFGIHDDYREFIIQLIKRILDETDSHILLLPHVFSNQSQDDHQPSASVHASLASANHGRLHLVNQPLNERELKSLVGNCDFFIGSRMHSCIAALSQGIPCIGVAYSQKFVGVFDTVGQRDSVLLASDMSAAEMVESIMQRIQHPEHDRNTLEHAEAIRRTLQTVFTRMLGEGQSVQCNSPLSALEM